MRIRRLLVATAVIAAATAQTASAQATPSRARSQRESTAIRRGASRLTYQGKRSSRSHLPPPPPVPLRSSRGGTSRRSAGLGMIGMEETGRNDQAGKSVPFYPTVRGKVPQGVRHSAARGATPTVKPRENPQKNPYKMPG